MNPIQAAIDHFEGNASRFAEAIGVTPQAVCFWRDGKRTIPAAKCPSIERATNGAVRCEAMRPDVDWSYIRAASSKTQAPANIGNAATQGVAQGVANV